jgi:peptidoglycan/LPS O-acetylase OafA/YrhL
LKYVKSLDGVRAVAALSVFLYHVWKPMSSGFLGVDVFFVLSGYLITGILVRELLTSGSISLRRFYIMRSLRLWPPLILIVLLGLPFYSTLGKDGTLAGYGITSIATLSYTQDIWIGFWRDPLGGFGHTWSLALEWQFYLLWPTVVLMFRHRLDRLAAFALGLGFAATAMFVFNWNHSWIPLFMPQTRGIGLCIGSALGAFCVLRERRAPILVNPWLCELSVVALLAWIGLTSLMADMIIMSVKILVTCLITAVLIFMLRHSINTWSTTILASWPMAWMGKVSYSFYVLHIPVLWVTDRYLDLRTWQMVPLQFAISAAGALSVFVAIERPVMTLRSRMRSRRDTSQPEDVKSENRILSSHSLHQSS